MMRALLLGGGIVSKSFLYAVLIDRYDSRRLTGSWVIE
jgi:hypothetical protein